MIKMFAKEKFVFSPKGKVIYFHMLMFLYLFSYLFMYFIFFQETTKNNIYIYCSLKTKSK